jgi:nucleoside-diphosphate-sugar epimerase
MKNAFVTGGAGFLGLNLIGQLVADGWKVLAFDRAKSHARHLDKLGIQLVEGDITDTASCERAMPEDVDTVFHLAGDTSHWKLGDARQTRTNVEGTRVVVSTALKRKARHFVHTSSIAAYGLKRLAELEVMRGIQEGLSAVILNPANIIGPFDYGGWSRFFTLIDKGRLPGIPPGKASFCHAREVARAHIAASDRGRCGDHYLLGGADASFLEVVRQIGELLSRKVPSRPIPAFLAKAIGRLSLWGSYLTRKEPDVTPEKATLLSGELLCSSHKAEQELGYKTVPLQTMLEDCYRWMLEEGLLCGSAFHDEV